MFAALFKHGLFLCPWPYGQRMPVSTLGQRWAVLAHAVGDPTPRQSGKDKEGGAIVCFTFVGLRESLGRAIVDGRNGSAISPGRRPALPLFLPSLVDIVHRTSKVCDFRCAPFRRPRLHVTTLLTSPEDTPRSFVNRPHSSSLYFPLQADLRSPLSLHT